MLSTEKKGLTVKYPLIKPEYENELSRHDLKLDIRVTMETIWSRFIFYGKSIFELILTDLKVNIFGIKKGQWFIYIIIIFYYSSTFNFFHVLKPQYSITRDL